MKLLGIISKKIDRQKFDAAAQLLVRNKNEVVSFKQLSDSFSLYFIHHKNDIFTIDNSKNLIIFPEQYSETYAKEKGYLEINSLIIDYSNKSQVKIKSDYLALKTIYYSNIENDFIFCTEIKSILHYYPKEKFTINKDSQIEFLIYQFNWYNRTLFNEIFIVETRQEIVYNIEKNIVSSSFYENYPRQSKNPMNFKQFNENFVNAISNVNKSGKKYLWLSGGLDSRIILASLIKTGDKLDKIINFGKKNIRDCKYAKSIIQHFALESNFINYEITSEIITQNAINHLWINEGPSGHLNSHLSYTLSNITDDLVLFDGYGGDIILGGKHWAKILTNITKASKYLNLALLNRALTPAYNTKLDIFDQRIIPLEVFENYNVKDEIRLHEFLYHDNYMRRKVRHGGPKIGEEFGIVHYPFYYKSIFDSCIEIPIEDRKDHQFYNDWIKDFFVDIADFPSTTLDVLLIKKKRKSLIYRAFSKIIRLLKRFVERIIRKPLTQTFRYVDPDEWLRQEANYRNMITSVLFSKKTKDRGFYNITELQKMLQEHLKFKANYGHFFAQLFDVEIVFRLFIDQIPKENVLLDDEL